MRTPLGSKYREKMWARSGVAESNVVVLDSRGDVLPSVGSSCDVAVLRQEDFEASQAFNVGSTQRHDPAMAYYTENTMYNMLHFKV